MIDYVYEYSWQKTWLTFHSLKLIEWHLQLDWHSSVLKQIFTLEKTDSTAKPLI